MTGASAAARIVYVAQGEIAVEDDPNTVVTTLLGSCVAVCLHCPLARVGGMNHILLPDVEDGALQQGKAIHTMELLINPMLRRGARRDRIEAKVFGGAIFSGAMGFIGSRNVKFALEFLEREGIALAGKSVGGRQARRVEFWPESGRVRQKLVQQMPVEVPQPASTAPAGGSLELF